MNEFDAFDTLTNAKVALESAGVDVPCSPWDTAGAIMIAEAVNWAAKTIDYKFYGIKPAVIDAAIAIGCDGGWGSDGCFFLADDRVGVASFHDPAGDIRADGHWPHPWTGVRRQDAAFDILVNPAVRRLYREATAPDGAVVGISDTRVRKVAARITG